MTPTNETGPRRTEEEDMLAAARKHVKDWLTFDTPGRLPDEVGMWSEYYITTLAAEVERLRARVAEYEKVAGQAKALTDADAVAVMPNEAYGCLLDLASLAPEEGATT